MFLTLFNLIFLDFEFTFFMSVIMWFFKKALNSLSGHRRSWKNKVSRAVGEILNRNILNQKAIKFVKLQWFTFLMSGCSVVGCRCNKSINSCGYCTKSWGKQCATYIEIKINMFIREWIGLVLWNFTCARNITKSSRSLLYWSGFISKTTLVEW